MGRRRLVLDGRRRDLRLPRALARPGRRGVRPDAPGVNHLAFVVEDRALLDRIRAESSAHGWHEMFADRYPHAGGDEHTALYLENSEGFEVELVVGD